MAVQKASYVYNPDGLLKEINHDSVDNDYDQENVYDFAGRLRTNNMGDGTTNPYTQSIEYDAFGNMTYRDTHTYSFSGRAFTATYTNNRINSGDTSHDKIGNVIKTKSGDVNHPHDIYSEFDAAGRQWRWEEYGPHGDLTKKAEETTFDGDGRPAKKVKLTSGYVGTPPNGYWGSWYDLIEYFYFYSSVTGQKISEISNEAESIKGFVYMGDTVIVDNYMRVTDPVSGSTRQVNGSGVPVTYDPYDEESSHVEMAGLGTAVPPVQPTSMPPPDYDNGGYVGNAKDGCEVEGMPVTCSRKTLYDYGEERPDFIIKETRYRKVYLGDSLTSMSLGVRSSRSYAHGPSANEEEPDIVLPPEEVIVRDFAVIAGMAEASYGMAMMSGLQEREPCARMARRAQKVANEVLDWAKKENKTAGDALSLFDRSFTPFYIGQIWTGTWENISYFRKTSGGIPTTKRLPADYGQQDFREEFLDAEATRFMPATDNWGNMANDFKSDQVHHFVGHFSGGINGAFLSSSAQELGDWWGDNPGDVALTNAAYEIGKDLAKDPRQLGNIGSVIQSSICR